MVKQILFSTVLVLSVSCGKNEPLTQLGQGAESLAQGIGNVGEDIGQIPRILGHQFLGTNIDHEKEHNKIDSRLTDLENRVNEIESNLESLYNSIDDLDVNQDTLSQSISLQQGQLTQLLAMENITDIIDPCGDFPNHFDEVILKTSSGKFMAYFEQSGKRFLSELPNGNYRTTDKQACNFTISGTGVNRQLTY